MCVARHYFIYDTESQADPTRSELAPYEATCNRNVMDLLQT